jgi:hypothetical protein
VGIWRLSNPLLGCGVKHSWPLLSRADEAIECRPGSAKGLSRPPRLTQEAHSLPQ